MALGENGCWQRSLLPWMCGLSEAGFSQSQKEGTYLNGDLILPQENRIGLLGWEVHQNHSRPKGRAAA